MNYSNWIRSRTHSREHLDHFLNGASNNVMQFDPDVGYIPKRGVTVEGMNGSRASYSYGPWDERRQLNGLTAPCRINTYGDSFTQCSQTNDGETWQEYLAAHLGEPIRNFGVGGHGVHQAMLRLLQKEATPIAAENVIFYIWGDDHHRSLMPWRGFFCFNWFQDQRRWDMFHINPWRHLVFQPATGRFEERPNFCPTPQSLYHLTDPDFVYEHMKDNLAVQLHALRNGVSGVDLRPARRAADALNFPWHKGDADVLAEQADRFFDLLAHRSTIHTLEHLLRFVRREKKNLFVLHGTHAGVVQEYLQGAPKNKNLIAVLDFLKRRKIPHLDILDQHKEEFAQFKLTAAEYAARYFIGHYNPKGNHFFAFAIKDAIVEWLNPKPPTYRELTGGIHYRGYFHEAKRRHA